MILEKVHLFVQVIVKEKQLFWRSKPFYWNGAWN